MTWLGLAVTFLCALLLCVETARHRRSGFPGYGWMALAALAAAEWLMLRRVEPVSTFFTPIAWSCYILAADAAVFAVSGRSLLRGQPAVLVRMVLLSIPLWLIFEGYNLRLVNWSYDGLPMNRALKLLGYAWSFATITPAILETAELVESFGWFGPAPARRLSGRAELIMILFGAACLVAPLTVSARIAAYLFALVWVGFIFLLDPVNRRIGLPSILADFAAGRRGRFYSLLLAGFLCGWFWEFWNYWAAAKWHYIFPMFQTWKIFEMPLPGYLGFVPFGVECFVMYVTASWLVGGALGRRPAASVRRSQAD
jgi:hypothetical protein